MEETTRRVEAEMAELSRKLRQYQHEYYIEGRPSASDREYDRLFDRLTQLEEEHPRLRRSDSPTQRVGSDLTSDLPEVEHSLPVLSLDKAYSLDEIRQWMQRTEKKGGELSYVVEEKIDGLSIVLYYEEGLLTRAVTRGNGRRGNDVTGNVKTIGAVPLRLTESRTLAVRGEIYLPKSRFAAINQQQETPYANPRNLAAGTLRRIRSAEVARIPLSIFIYEGFFQEEELPSHQAVIARLRELGFRINPRTTYFRSGAEEPLVHYIQEEGAARESLDYEIDGLVIKVNEIEPREKLGYTGHHPRWAVAYKFESPQGETILRSIDLQVGRTGRITPVARVDAVSIGGSLISNVTLHNEDYINLLEVAPGDRVAVSKRGDVIPAVEEVLERNPQGTPVWQMPGQCPSCGENLEKEGAHHFCRNSQCPDQKRGRLRFFVGAGGMDIPNLGPETVDYLLEEGLIGDIADLYKIDWTKLIGKPGFGIKKVDLIRRGIEESRRQPFEAVLRSLGIPEIGQRTARALIQGGFSSMEKLLETADAQDAESLLQVEGIGEKTSELLIQELNQPSLRAVVAELREAGLQLETEEPSRTAPDSEDNSLAGQRWCITGSFEHFKPRDKAGELIEGRGGKVVSGITGATTHLLAGEKAGSKLKKARERGIPVITEEEFLILIQGNQGATS